MSYSLEEIKEKFQIGKSPDSDCDALSEALPLISKVQEEGSSFLLKVDGERSSDIYTLMINGGRLGDDYIKQETSDLVAGLSELFSQYADLFWKV